MRSYAEQNVGRSLLLTGELRTLLRRLEEAGIPALAYKGPVLAQDLYGSVALRDMLDLDILVAKKDALRARDLLFERGYRSAVPTGERWDSYLLWSGCNFPLVQDSTGFVVELHWTPEACLPPRHVAALWQRQQFVSLAGMQVPTFARQDLLLLLCLHGCRHMWERLEWLVGVAELLRMVDVVWDELLRLAELLRRPAGPAARIDPGAPPPGSARPRRHPAGGPRGPPTGQLMDAACRQMFSETPVLAHQLGFPFHDFQLCSKERLRDRTRYVMQRLTAPAWKSGSVASPLVAVPGALRRASAAAGGGVRRLAVAEEEGRGGCEH
jgi:hypothetical protein